MRVGSSLDVAESCTHLTDTDRRKTDTGTEVLISRMLTASLPAWPSSIADLSSFRPSDR